MSPTRTYNARPNFYEDIGLIAGCNESEKDTACKWSQEGPALTLHPPYWGKVSVCGKSSYHTNTSVIGPFLQFIPNVLFPWNKHGGLIKWDWPFECMEKFIITLPQRFLYFSSVSAPNSLLCRRDNAENFDRACLRRPCEAEKGTHLFNLSFNLRCRTSWSWHGDSCLNIAGGESH